MNKNCKEAFDLARSIASKTKKETYIVHLGDKKWIVETIQPKGFGHDPNVIGVTPTGNTAIEGDAENVKKSMEVFGQYFEGNS